MINSDGSYKPCTNGSPALHEIMEKGKDALCFHTDYRVVRLVELIAMPIGRHDTDLSRKKNS
jgi:hypothetical protein